MNVTYSNPTVVGNTLQVTVQIQNTSGTWIYIQQNTTSTPNIPVTLPYTVYLLGPGGTKTFNNVSFTVNSYLEFDVTTPTGLNFQSLNPQCSALFGATTVDFLTRGLLTIALPPNAFDESPVNSLTGDIDPLLDNVFSTLGNGIGSLVVDLKNFNLPGVATDVGSLAANCGQVQSSIGQNLDQKRFYNRPGKYVLFQRQRIVIARWRHFEPSCEIPIASRFGQFNFRRATNIHESLGCGGDGFDSCNHFRFSFIIYGFANRPDATHPHHRLWFHRQLHADVQRWRGHAHSQAKCQLLSAPTNLITTFPPGQIRRNWTVQVVNGSQTSNLGYFTVNAAASNNRTGFFWLSTFHRRTSADNGR